MVRITDNSSPIVHNYIKIMRLDQLTTGQTATIVKILGHGAFRKRMIEMGFVKGQTVKVLLHAPLRDPIKYSIMGYEVSLRRSEASLVEVIPNEPEKSTGEKEATEAAATKPHDRSA